jgi:hypothetical protein
VSLESVRLSQPFLPQVRDDAPFDSTHIRRSARPTRRASAIPRTRCRRDLMDARQLRMLALHRDRLNRNLMLWARWMQY